MDATLPTAALNVSCANGAMALRFDEQRSESLFLGIRERASELLRKFVAQGQIFARDRLCGCGEGVAERIVEASLSVVGIHAVEHLLRLR